MDNTVRIGGTVIPCALKGLTVTYQDVDLESGRAADGTMKRNRVGVKRSISITTPALPPSKVSAILNAVSPESFSVEFYDPKRGERTTGTFYAGDRPAPVYSDYLNLFDSMSIELVEM